MSQARFWTVHFVSQSKFRIDNVPLWRMAIKLMWLSWFARPVMLNREFRLANIVCGNSPSSALAHSLKCFVNGLKRPYFYPKDSSLCYVDNDIKKS